MTLSSLHLISTIVAHGDNPICNHKLANLAKLPIITNTKECERTYHRVHIACKERKLYDKRTSRSVTICRTKPIVELVGENRRN